MLSSKRVTQLGINGLAEMCINLASRNFINGNADQRLAGRKDYLFNANTPYYE